MYHNSVIAVCMLAIGCQQSDETSRREEPVPVKVVDSCQVWLHGLPEGITVLRNESINIGSVMAGETIRRVLKFTNTTDQVLTLKNPSDLVASCSCTKVELSVDAILPGSTASLNLTIDTGNIHENGPNTQLVRVVLGTKEADAVATARFVVVMDVSGVLSVFPQQMGVTVGPDATTTVSFQLNTGQGETSPDWSRLGMSSTSDSFTLASIEAKDASVLAIVQIDLGTQAFDEGQLVFMLPTVENQETVWSETTPHITAVASIRASSDTAVSVRPQQLTVIFSGGSTESQILKLLLQGQNLDRVTIEDKRVCWWEPRKLATNQVLVLIRFRDTVQDGTAPLIIHVDGEEISVSIRSSRIGNSDYSPIN